MFTIVYDEKTRRVKTVYQGLDAMRIDPDPGFAVICVPRELEEKCHNYVRRVNFDAAGKLIGFDREQPTVAPLFSTIIPSDTSHILFIRDLIGLGDVISSLSAVQAVRLAFPKAFITYRGKAELMPVLEGHPAINLIQDTDHAYSNPSGTVVVNFSNPCPCGEYETAKGMAIDKSRNEIYTAHAGVAWTGEQPKLYLSEDEKRWAYGYMRKYPSPNPKIGIALRTAEIWKDYPHTLEFIEAAKKRYQIFTFDAALKTGIDGVVDTAGLSIRQVMGLLPHMDCVVTPDTAILHLCDALSVSCIGLFGSMRSNLHQGKYESTVTYLQGRCIYGLPPCMYKVCEGKGNIQPCMTDLDVKRLIHQVALKLKGGFISGL